MVTEKNTKKQILEAYSKLLEENKRLKEEQRVQAENNMDSSSFFDRIKKESLEKFDIIVDKTDELNSLDNKIRSIFNVNSSDITINIRQSDKLLTELKSRYESNSENFNREYKELKDKTDSDISNLRDEIADLERETETKKARKEKSLKEAFEEKRDVLNSQLDDKVSELKLEREEHADNLEKQYNIKLEEHKKLQDEIKSILDRAKEKREQFEEVVNKRVNSTSQMVKNSLSEKVKIFRAKKKIEIADKEKSLQILRDKISDLQRAIELKGQEIKDINNKAEALTIANIKANDSDKALKAVQEVTMKISGK